MHILINEIFKSLENLNVFRIRNKNDAKWPTVPDQRASGHLAYFNLEIF